MAKAKRKRRTSIRTAAGVAQEKFLGRLRALRDDPLIVLPECPQGEPRPVAKVRQRLERVKQGKIGFLDRRDKGIVGAVVQSVGLAKLESAPRLLDMKVAGKRRFFMVRGQVQRTCMLGVQNHDEPRALLMAYRTMAKKSGLHFFARPRLWCTGSTPAPPEEWVEELGRVAEARVTKVDGGWAFGKPDVPRIRLTFRGGPFIDGDGRHGNLHELLGGGYAGPRERHPVEIDVVLPDGTLAEPDREFLAEYRAGVKTEREVIDDATARWRKKEREKASRFILGEQDFGTDQAAFLDALSPEAWERPVLERLTKGGFARRAATTADVFEHERARLGDAISPLVPDADAFLAARAKTPARDVARQAVEEAEARRRDARLPRIAGGPETRLVDAVARASLRGRQAALDALRAGLDAGQVPMGHIAAFTAALGGDLNLQSRFNQDAKLSAQVLQDAARRVLASEGDAYIESVQHFLQEAGSAERPQAA